GTSEAATSSSVVKGRRLRAALVGGADGAPERTRGSSLEKTGSANAMMVFGKAAIGRTWLPARRYPADGTWIKSCSRPGARLSPGRRKAAKGTGDNPASGARINRGGSSNPAKGPSNVRESRCKA